SSFSAGRWVMSMVVLPSFLWRPPYGAARWLPPRMGAGRVTLLRVELDDQLLLDRRVDDRALGQRVHQDAQPGGDDLQPGRHRPGPGLSPGHHERGQLAGLLPDLDDVVRADPEGRDVHLAAVDHEVAVRDQLPGG